MKGSAEEERDDDRALGWINEAIAIARLLPDVKVSAMQTVFNQNGLPSSGAIKVTASRPCG